MECAAEHGLRATLGGTLPCSASAFTLHHPDRVIHSPASRRARRTGSINGAPTWRPFVSRASAGDPARTKPASGFTTFRWNPNATSPLPRPRPQFEVVNGEEALVARTDFAWLEYRHVCEFDGRVK
ncbi:MAG: hypothetical protein ACRDO7_15060 [Nocardioidaceae bacterium]